MKPLILGLMLLTCAISGWAQTDKERPVVAVTGQAEIMVAPDEVVFQLESENVNLDVTKAKKETDDDVKKIVAVARSYQIEQQNIQTNYIRISERYGEYVTGKPRDFRGYAVTQNTTILLKDITRFEALLADLVVKAGVSDLSGVTFRASKMRAYMDQARAQAMKAAKEKAVALANEVGQRVGKAVNIAEAGLTVSAAYEEEDSNPASNYRNSVSAEITQSTSDNQGTIAPGMISIIARVKVTFELN